jgi:hypothetical protein
MAVACTRSGSGFPSSNTGLNILFGIRHMFRSYGHLHVEIYTWLLRVLGQVQGFRLTQHCFEYFIQ